MYKVVITLPNSNKRVKPTQGKHNRGKATEAGKFYFNNRGQLRTSSGAKLDKKTWLTREKMYSHKWKTILSCYSGYTKFVVITVLFYIKLGLQRKVHWETSRGSWYSMSVSSTSSPWWMTKMTLYNHLQQTFLELEQNSVQSTQRAICCVPGFAKIRSSCNFIYVNTHVRSSHNTLRASLPGQKDSQR